MTHTYTYAVLDISAEAYQEIRDKLKAAGYSDQFHKERDGAEVIDMHGIAVKAAGTSTGGTTARNLRRQHERGLPLCP
jgi:hypothetical protein